MALSDDLERIAAAAAAHGAVGAVLAAEPTAGRRLYLVAYGDEAPEWLVVDDDGAPLERRSLVRDTASIVAMCEVAADVAGGGDLEELRNRLTQLKIVEQPPGIEEAEEAALALERIVGAAPRVATPAFLDEVGVASFTLERALGQSQSPFADALRAATGSVDEFVRDVERRYKAELR